jgi:CheY-like chemotaxis protein
MIAARPEAQNRFKDLRILVVEDETLISFLVEDMLRELGCASIYHAGGIRAALSIIAEHKLDVAVLDVNLGGETVYPLAQRLAVANIPFVFATGYGRSGIAPDWAMRPVIQKPFGLESLAAAIAAVLPH